MINHVPRFTSSIPPYDWVFRIFRFFALETVGESGQRRRRREPMYLLYRLAPTRSLEHHGSTHTRPGPGAIDSLVHFFTDVYRAVAFTLGAAFACRPTAVATGRHETIECTVSFTVPPPKAEMARIGLFSIYLYQKRFRPSFFRTFAPFSFFLFVSKRKCPPDCLPGGIAL